MLPENDARHGSHAGYVAGCHEDCCQRARRRDDKRRAMLRLHVGPLTVPADRARAHLEKCVAWGMHPSSVDPDGMHGSTGARVSTGELTQILRTTEARILAVTPIPGVNCWPAYAAVRRLQALLALGHRQDTLAAETGISTQYLSMLITGYRPNKRMTPAVWRSIADVYERLSMTVGESEKSRRRAQRAGWAVPLAWDDLDDPDAKPYVAKSRRKHYKPEDLVAEWEHLRCLGVSIEQAAAQLGVTVDAIQKAIRVHAREGAA